MLEAMQPIKQLPMEPLERLVSNPQAQSHKNGHNQLPPTYVKVQSTPSAHQLALSSPPEYEMNGALLKLHFKISTWINKKEHLILSQFIELMETVAPHITSNSATDIFNRIDASNNGQIATITLLHDHFLSRIIQKVHSDPEATLSSGFHNYDNSNGFHHVNNEKEDEDTTYSNMTNEKLIQEIKSLNRWILTSGQPAVAKVADLESMISVYEMERSNLEIEMDVMKEQLAQRDIPETNTALRDTTIALSEDNMGLRLQMEVSNDQLIQHHNDLKESHKATEEQKRAAEVLRQINDKYVQTNQKLMQQNHHLETTLKEFRTRFEAFDREAQLREEDALLHIEHLENLLQEHIITEDGKPQWDLTRPKSITADVQRIHVLDIMRQRSDVPSKKEMSFNDVCNASAGELHMYNEPMNSAGQETDMEIREDIWRELKGEFEAEKSALIKRYEALINEYKIKLAEKVSFDDTLEMERDIVDMDERKEHVQKRNGLDIKDTFMKLFQSSTLMWSLPMQRQ